MNGPFITQWLPLITHDAAQLGFTNLFSWHIWGWNHDAAADYAGVQLVTRQLCLENYWHIANALCVDKAPLLSPFDESIQLIDWLVLGATHCETIFSNSFFKIAIGQNVKLVSFHSERSQRIEQCTKQMNQMNVRNQQCYCKDIQLMQTSESPQGWIIELAVTIQLEHGQTGCISCESVMVSNDFSP